MKLAVEPMTLPIRLTGPRSLNDAGPSRLVDRVSRLRVSLLCRFWAMAAFLVLSAVGGPLAGLGQPGLAFAGDLPQPKSLATGMSNPQDSGPARYAPQVGQAHADFLLPDIETGKPIRLSDYRGKKIILVHFASW